MRVAFNCARVGGVARAQREVGRLQKKRQREQVNHVVVDLEQKVFGQHDEQNASRAQARARDEGAEDFTGDLRGPDEREQVDDCAEAVAERESEEAGQSVGRGVVGRGRREEVAGREERAAQTSLRVEQAVVQHVEGNVRERRAPHVDEEERERDDEPELAPDAPRRERLRRDVEVPCDG